ncbi:MAG TPA: agmatine deiminase family protein [Acidobacteriaceae bacterium]|nr:agmatine deiminase family protein [Acidobacteriaceae bacterium]
MTAARYRMPAEWEPHAATWIAWPHNPEDWPGKFQPIPWVYAEIVRHLSRVEDIHILVNDLAAERRAATILQRGGANLAHVRFHRWPTDRVWLRDSGPIFVKDQRGQKAVTNWKFNAWAKYPNWHHDDKIPHRVAKLYKMHEITPEVPAGGTRKKAHRIVLEGGSIDVNGAGLLLTTEECLLSEIQQRNPGLGDEVATREALERAFRDYLGIEQTIWLNRGCAGDDTHGHVDDICRFVAENTILTCVEPNTADENHLPLAENLERLHAARSLRGKPLHIVELPMPAPVVFEGQRLPASYANFYIANGLVLVPTFNDANDRHALNIIAGCFPNREVVGIHAVDLVWGLGTLHCLSQQEPA